MIRFNRRTMTIDVTGLVNTLDLIRHHPEFAWYLLRKDRTALLSVMRSRADLNLTKRVK